MPLNLHTISSSKGTKGKKKRIGRGNASGGNYSGRGLKGQRARSGGKSGLKRKGMKRIILSMPKKRGFKSPNPDVPTVNVGVLGKAFSDGDTVSPATLIAKGLIQTGKHGVKILGSGDISVKLTVEKCKLSETAKQKIEKAGGNIK